MSAIDRMEAQRLSDRIIQIHAGEMKAKEGLALAIRKYTGKTQGPEAVRVWADVALIAGVMIARSPKMRAYVTKKAVDEAKDYMFDKTVRGAVQNDEISDNVLTVIDILSSSNAWIAGLKTLAPTTLGTGDDEPNEVAFFKDKLSAVQSEYATCYMMLSIIMNKYDKGYLCNGARTMGPQMMAR